MSPPSRSSDAQFDDLACTATHNKLDEEFPDYESYSVHVERAPRSTRTMNKKPLYGAYAPFDNLHARDRHTAQPLSNSRSSASTSAPISPDSPRKRASTEHPTQDQTPAKRLKHLGAGEYAQALNQPKVRRASRDPLKSGKVASTSSQGLLSKPTIPKTVDRRPSPPHPASQSSPDKWFGNNEFHAVEDRMRSSRRPSASSSQGAPSVSSLRAPSKETRPPWQGNMQDTLAQEPEESLLALHKRRIGNIASVVRGANTTQRKRITPIAQEGSKASQTLQNPPSNLLQRQFKRDHGDDSSDELAVADLNHDLPKDSQIRRTSFTSKSDKPTPKKLSVPDMSCFPSEGCQLHMFQQRKFMWGVGTHIQLHRDDTAHSECVFIVVADRKSISLELNSWPLVLCATLTRSIALFSKAKIDHDQEWTFIQFKSSPDLADFKKVLHISQIGLKEIPSDRMDELLRALRKGSITQSMKPWMKAIFDVKPNNKSHLKRITKQEYADTRSEEKVEGGAFDEHTSERTHPWSRSMETRSSQKREQLNTLLPEAPSRFEILCADREQWNEPLIYPARGRNRATVDWTDLTRLNDDEFLNDNIISFCLLHMQNHRHGQSLARRVYFFNTFFYTALTRSTKGRKGINFDAVKNWTKNDDLFSYDYIVVPINRDLHWYCAIICNIRHLQLNYAASDVEEHAASFDSTRATRPASVVDLSSPVKPAGVHTGPRGVVNDEEATTSVDLDEQTSQLSLEDLNKDTAMDETEVLHALPKKGKRQKPPGPTFKAEEPLIVILDSLGTYHADVTRNLKDYLKAEALDKRGMSIEVQPKGMNARGLPEQQNFSDCGVYLIAYLRKFMKDPARFVEGVIKQDLSFWATLKANTLRDSFLNKILRTYDSMHFQGNPTDEKSGAETRQESSSTRMTPEHPQASTYQTSNAVESRNMELINAEGSLDRQAYGSTKEQTQPRRSDSDEARKAATAERLPMVTTVPFQERDNEYREVTAAVSSYVQVPASPEAPMGNGDTLLVVDGDFLVTAPPEEDSSWVQQLEHEASRTKSPPRRTRQSLSTGSGEGAQRTAERATGSSRPTTPSTPKAALGSSGSSPRRSRAIVQQTRVASKRPGAEIIDLEGDASS